MRKILFLMPFILLGTLNAGAQKKQITLEEIWSAPTFRTEYVSGLRSMNDGVHYTILESQGDAMAVSRYSYKTGELVNAVVRPDDLKPEGAQYPLTIEDYTFSSDEKKILIATEVERIYRHSTRAFNYVYDLKDKSLTAVDTVKQRYATFSPGADKVAYVRDNDLWIMPLDGSEKTRVTTDGKINNIINGATDWVYEEEFGFDKAFFWSPDGKYIAYYRFDESAVKEFDMTMYGALYPTTYRFKYPKAGEDNAKVTIYIYNTKTKKSIKLGLGDYEYIPRIKWTADPAYLSVQKMNRHQNELSLVLANAETGALKTILSESSETYIDISDDLYFLKDKSGFLWTSEKDGYNHIYHYSMDGKLISKLGDGKWDVKHLNGVDEHESLVYYTASETSPMERHIYSVDLSGKNKKLLTPGRGTDRAVFSTGMKYFINYHTDITTPYNITLRNSSGKVLRVLKDNKALTDKLAEYALGAVEFFKCPSGGDVELNGWMIKPPGFDPTKKYPVLMYVYGGPGIQTVNDAWGGHNYLWYQMLAEKGYIVVSVDNRGTGSRGAEFKKCTYKALGKLETEDQLAAAQYLQKLDYVNSGRIGIWGWSYGAFMTTSCLALHSDVFRCGIAVAPVTNWRYYDSIYTERYMQTPQENPRGYDDNSPINHAAGIKSKYLLIHGTADDNVHFQNTVEMVNALVKNNVQFDLFFYPDKNHSIYGGNTRLHLYTKMTDYLLKNL